MRTRIFAALASLASLFSLALPAMAYGDDTATAEMASQSPELQVERFSFDGNSLFSNEELTVVVLHYLGRPLHVDDLYSAADELTLFYRSKGYGLASVILPPQDVSDGTILFEIIEGRIDRVSVSGNADYDYQELEQHLTAITPGKVFNAQETQRELLDMNQLPGMAARVVVEPGDGYGHAAIDLQLEEDGWQFTTTLDNYGRETLGEYRLGLHLLANNPFTLGDTLQASVLISEDDLLRYGNLSYGLPVFTLRDQLHFTINRADYEAGAEFAALGVIGENNFAEIGYRLPFARTADGEWSWQAAIRRFDTFSHATALPLAPSESELDIAELGISVREKGKRGSFAASLLASGNGKSNQSSVFGIDGDSQRLKLALDIRSSYAFNANWWLNARSEAAYSRETLVDSQQFSLGGPQSIRGYEPAVVRGDAGYLASLELHRYLEWFSVPGSISLQLDHGRSFRRLLIGEPDGPYRGLDISSAGIGLQLGDRDGFRLHFAVHHPIGSTPVALAIDDSTKAWASVGYQF